MRLPSTFWFRLGTLLLAAALGAQAIWLLAAELSRPQMAGFPFDRELAATAAKERGDADRAAAIGAIRGDLWAEAAYTYADLLWAQTDADWQSVAAQARTRIERAVENAPHEAGAWLLLAALAAHGQWHDLAPAESLKMSYYTGPGDAALMRLRLSLATGSDLLGDPDISQFAQHDVSLLVAAHESLVIADAYRDAPPAGKAFIEKAVGDIDASALAALRANVGRP